GDRRPCFFFFQAEDGIRDFHVTGVQTCALPICRWTKESTGVFRESDFFTDSPVSSRRCWSRSYRVTNPAISSGLMLLMVLTTHQIGRASCRERVCSSVEDVA